MKFFLFLALLCPLLSQAQTSVFQLDLSKQQLALPETKFHVAEVLDLRANPNTIGWVQRGMYNVPTPADLPGGAAVYLKQ